MRAALFFAFASCTTPNPVEIDPAALDEIDRVLGTEPASVVAGGPLLAVEDCGGMEGLVVPRGEIVFPLFQATVTATGRLAECRGGKGRHATFVIELRDAAGVHELVRHDVGGRHGARTRRAVPFTVTFFAERRSSLVLRTEGDALARPAWGSVRVHSRPLPAIP